MASTNLSSPSKLARARNLASITSSCFDVILFDSVSSLLDSISNLIDFFTVCFSVFFPIVCCKRKKNTCRIIVADTEITVVDAENNV
ncbi:hypothetical protein GIB67_038165, partial [Kingdonia uniflora]